MLADIADNQNPILGRDLLKKIPHLLRRGERGFVQHVEMSAGRFGFGPASQEALQGARLNSGFAELGSSARCGRKTLHLITFPLRTFADGFKAQGLP
jgi:hypothetical protein